MKYLHIIFLPIITILVFVLIVVQLIISNELAGATGEMETIEEKIVLLSDENAILQKQLAIARSLTSLTEQSKKLGFVSIRSTIVIPPIEPVALKSE